MKRTTTSRRAFLFAIGMALGKLDSLHAEGGQLTCDLNQWHHVTFKYRGKTISVPVADIWKELSGEAS